MKKYSLIKKANFRPNLHKRKIGFVVTLFIVIILGIIFPWFISKLSAVVLYPIHATTNWVKTSDSVFPLYLRSRADLVTEIEQLKASSATDSGTQSSIKRLLVQNMQLRGLLGVSGDEDRVVAQVLGRPGVLPYDLMQIDKGSNQNVLVGAPVFSGLDSLVGIVTQVFPEYAFVDLFTSPGFISTAYIFGPDVMAPLEGVGGGVARVKLPQGVNIKVGQLVILPGVSSALYGEIVSVQNEPTQPEQYGYIAPPIALNHLLYVSVGLKAINNDEDFNIDEVMRKAVQKQTVLENYEDIVASSTASTSLPVTEVN